MKKSAIAAIILAAACLCAAAVAGAIKKNASKPVTVYVSDAVLSEGLHTEGSGQQSIISGWDSADDTIHWETQLQRGNYTVTLRYKQPYFGSAVRIDADGQQLAALLPQSEGGNIEVFEAGIMAISNKGTVTVALQGLQHGISFNEDGSLNDNEPLPQIQSITFTPTADAATSQPADILKEFKGISLFDGKSFDGWEGNDEESLQHFRIEDGSIVGGSLDSELADNHFVRTIRDYQDFELRLKYKVTYTDDSYNGGIQLRSQRSTLPGQGCEMVGYQADIMAPRIGGLYDEKRRSVFLGMELSLPKGYRPDEWNEFIMRCEGPRVRLWLNGVNTTDHIEPFTERPLEGFGTVGQNGRIALQIHKGKPCEIRYKDIMIEEL